MNHIIEAYYSLSLVRIVQYIPWATTTLITMLIFYTLLTLALCLPVGVTAIDALHRVLQLVDVGSKRFLTNKV